MAARKSPPARTPPANYKALLEAARLDHAADMERLGKNLLEAAKRHNLCDEFWYEIDNLNDGLTVKLEVPRTETWHFRISIDFIADVDNEDGCEGWALADDVCSDILDLLQSAADDNEILGAIKGKIDVTGTAEQED